jgi:hypothetical protein
MLGVAVKGMAAFPTGSWFLEPECPDPLTWLARLDGLPTFGNLTRCLAEIRSLSAILTALTISVMPSDIEDDGVDDDDADAEEDELESEDLLVVVKSEKAISNRQKGEAVGGSGPEANMTPVRFLFVFCLSTTGLTGCCHSAIDVLLPRLRVSRLPASLAVASVVRSRNKNARTQSTFQERPRRWST